jgi:FAD/FMN-containing dehydrogenase
VAAHKGLFAELKRRFDPSGVLNPGLFAGGL